MGMETNGNEKDRHRRRVEPGEVAEMVSLHRAGMSITAISAKLGWSWITVQKHLTNAGEYSPRGHTTQSEILEMVRLFRDGMPIDEIAMMVGRDRSTVARLLDRSGVRPISDSFVSGEEAGEMVRRYGIGVSIRDVAKSLGRSQNTVIKHLTDAGLPIQKPVRGWATPVPPSLTAAEVEVATVSYLAGASLKEIAEEFGCTAPTVGNHLKRAGVRIRRSHEYKRSSATHATGRHVPMPNECEIADLYLAGESSAAIANRFGVSDEHVLKVLRAAGVSIRSVGFQTKMTPEKVAAALYRHGMGESMVSIAGSFDVNPITVRRHLESARQKTAVSTSRLATLPETPGIVARYQAGESAEVIAVDLGCSPNAVIRRLRAAGVQLRPMGPGSVIGGPVGVAVIRRYLDGESSTAIARSIGHSTNAVLRHLRRCGIEIRPSIGRSVISDDQASDVIERYRGGESAKSIARSIGRSPNAVLRLLRTRGELTEAGEGRTVEVAQ